MKIDIGIEPAKREDIAKGLSRVLADTYTLYLKTHNFHWNVTGPMFQTLHLMFETHYNELALAVDLVADGRIKPIIGATSDPLGALAVHDRLRHGDLVGRGAIDWS